MQKLGLSLSLPSVKKLGGEWQPDNDPSLLAWWKLATGVTYAGALPYGVSLWRDHTGNGYDFQQSTLSEQPTYTGTPGVNKGTIAFNPAATQNLEIAQQITLNSGQAFTIGCSAVVANIGGCFFADNDAAAPNVEFTRATSMTQFRVRIAGNAAMNFALDTLTWPDIKYWVLTRTSAGLFEFWVNGTKQTDTHTDNDVVLIDNFGVRKTDTNPFDGKLRDAQIYTDTSADLTANVNAYLATTIV